MSVKVTLQTETDASFSKIYNTKTENYQHNTLDLNFGDNSTVTVHDFVIESKCEYFSALLKQPFKESTTREISLDLKDDQIHAKSIQQFFQLLYGKSVCVSLESLVMIWKAANRFQYNKIKKIESLLLENITFLTDDVLSDFLFGGESNLNIAPFLDQIPLKKLNEIKNSIEDPRILRQIIEATMRRYKLLAGEMKSQMTSSLSSNRAQKDQNLSLESMLGSLLTK